MLRPAITQLISKNDSYYSLVIGVAKRAREIANELFEENKTLEEKPVKTAVEEFAAGRYKIMPYDKAAEEAAARAKAEAEARAKEEAIAAAAQQEQNTIMEHDANMNMGMGMSMSMSMGMHDITVGTSINTNANANANMSAAGMSSDNTMNPASMDDVSENNDIDFGVQETAAPAAEPASAAAETDIF